MAEPKPLPEALPDCVLRLFWDCDPASLSASQDRLAVIDRVLSGGGRDAMCWLRAHTADDAPVGPPDVALSDRHSLRAGVRQAPLR